MHPLLVIRIKNKKIQLNNTAHHQNLNRLTKDQLLLLLLACAEPYVVSQSMAASSASCKHSRPPLNLDNEQELTKCDIVWISSQSHSSLSVKPHFL